MATTETDQTRQMSTREKIRERRLDRMRLGQAACDFVTLPSDPEIRVAIVPLTEADYRNVLQKISDMSVADDMAGAMLKDRVQAQEILVRSIREEHNLSQRIYDDVEDLLEDFEVEDVDHAIDCYNEMMDKSSPSLQGITEQELENLKKALQEMDWKELNGSSWYAAKRFLSRLSQQRLPASLFGSTSTSSAITTNDENESISDA